MPSEPPSPLASTLVPQRCGGLVAKILAGECVLVLGPRVGMPPELCGGEAIAIDDYLSRQLLNDLGEAGTGASGLREVILRYDRQFGAYSDGDRTPVPIEIGQ